MLKAKFSSVSPSTMSVHRRGIDKGGLCSKFNTIVTGSISDLVSSSKTNNFVRTLMNSELKTIRNFNIGTWKKFRIPTSLFAVSDEEATT